jgi:phage-related protein (TIGR01555 family)
MKQAIHKIPNLSEQVDSPEGEASVIKRVDVVDRVRNIMNTIIIDALEEYDIKSLTVAGVKDLMEQFAEALGAVVSMPVFILMGRNISGLGNGDSNKEGWYAQIEAWQNDILRKPIDRLVSLLILIENKGASDGGDYTLEFCPLYTPSDKDVAETDLKKEQAKKTLMETLTGYVNAGFMDQDEGREVIREEFDLQGDAPEPEEEVPAPITLNPGQKLVAPVPGQNNPAPANVGKKPKAKK